MKKKKIRLIFIALAVAVSLGSFQTKTAAQEEDSLTATLRARLDYFRPASPEKERRLRKAFSVVRELMSRGDSPSEREIILRAYLQLDREDKIFLNYLIRETPLHSKLISILQKEKGKRKAKRQIALGDAQKIRVQEAARIREEKSMQERMQAEHMRAAAVERIRAAAEERMREAARIQAEQKAAYEADAGLYAL